MAHRYRSWVVRAWSRDERGAVRLTIEEIHSGRLVELWGERAAEIEGLISAASITDMNGGDGRDTDSLPGSAVTITSTNPSSG